MTVHIKIRHRPDDTKWTPWFAWHPVKVGPGEWLWLGRVERKGSWQVTCVSGGKTWQWDYRMPARVEPVTVPPCYGSIRHPHTRAENCCDDCPFEAPCDRLADAARDAYAAARDRYNAVLAAQPKEKKDEA